MSESAAKSKTAKDYRRVGLRWLAGVLLAAIVVMSAVVMEQRDASLRVETLRLGATPVTLYAPRAAGPHPLVLVAHGFGGSRQMMDQISVTLARAGFAAAAFDFPGHGRNSDPMSRDVTRITGTTQQLVETTRQVSAAMLARADTSGPVSLVGHSMATDVIVRAAEDLPETGGLVAISMYSEAVTVDSPDKLLVISGAREGRLRDHALDVLAQLDPDAGENETAHDGDMVRRIAVAPHVGHVGVLYSAKTLEETAHWLRATVGVAPIPFRSDLTGAVGGVLLLALTLLAWPASRLLPRRPTGPAPGVTPLKTFLVLLAAPVPVALALAVFLPDLGPTPGATQLTGALFGYGAMQAGLAQRLGLPLPRVDSLAVLTLLFWGLALFAVALDRYGAAFVPATGGRLSLLAAMLPGALMLMLGDAALLAGAPFWRRVVARVVLVATLAGAMIFSPASLGLSFTVLPVLVLFFLVYGSFAFWIGQRRGAGGAWPASGICLAWSIAASTPIFAA